MPLGDSGPWVANRSRHTNTHTVFGRVEKPLKLSLEQDAIQNLYHETDTVESVLGGLATP